MSDTKYDCWADHHRKGNCSRDAERAALQRALDEFRADPRLQVPLDGPGSHKADLAELRLTKRALDEARAERETYAQNRVDLELNSQRAAYAKLCDERDQARATIVQLRATLDGADCTHREGGDTRHCGLDRPCFRCQGDEARAELATEKAITLEWAEHRDRALAAEEERDAALVQLNGAVQAAHAERDMHWKAKVAVLREALQHAEVLLHEDCDFRPVLTQTESAARDFVAGIRREALEEAASVACRYNRCVEQIRALARDGVAPKGAP